MKTLELIHVRLAGESPETLAGLVRTAVGSFPHTESLRIYRSRTVGSDLVVHLHGDVDGKHEEASELGTRLAALLRSYGLVEHSMWVEAVGPSPSPSPGDV